MDWWETLQDDREDWELWLAGHIDLPEPPEHNDLGTGLGAEFMSLMREQAQRDRDYQEEQDRAWAASRGVL